MEKIVNKTTEEKEEIFYKAIDGTIFQSARNCKQYEDTARCVIRSRLQIKQTNAWDLCLGNDDHNVEVIKGKPDDVKMYVAHRKNYLDWDVWRQRVKSFIESEIKDDDTTLIFENCDEEPYYVTTANKLIKRINENITKHLEENED